MKLKLIAATALFVAGGFVASNGWAQYTASTLYGSPRKANEVREAYETQNPATLNAKIALEKAIQQAQAEGKDVSDAQYFDRLGNQQLANGDDYAAQREYRAAQRSLAANGFTADLNSSAAIGDYAATTSAASNQQERQLDAEQARLDRRLHLAEARSKDVRDAQFFCTRGQQDLQNGDQGAAMRNFRAAEIALGGHGATESDPQAEALHVQREISQAQANNKAVMDARYYRLDGERDLGRGDEQAAMRDFRASEHALSMEQNPTEPNQPQ
jgi:hypothetical protein